MAKSPPRIGFLCGSLRKGSINQQLSKALQKKAKAAGAKTGEINLGTYDLPIYHGDLKTPPAFGVASCTPGPMSGIMVMRQMQFMLMRLGADLVPAQAGCGGAAKAFDAKGHLTADPASSLADKMIGQMLARIKNKR